MNPNAPPGESTDGRFDTIRATLRGWRRQVRQTLISEGTPAEDNHLIEGERVRTDAVGLSDEVIVKRLLEQKSGRMKQSMIVARTDWSASKVSRLLSSMEDEDRIERVRIGREKVVVDADRDDALI